MGKKLMVMAWILWGLIFVGSPVFAGSVPDTDDFIAALNHARFGGYSDWRMPDRKELHSIVNYDLTNPAINAVYFPKKYNSSRFRF